MKAILLVHNHDVSFKEHGGRIIKVTQFFHSDTRNSRRSIEEILDNLHTDKSALKSCSLVSRSFYPRTCQYLFQHAFIYHIGQETLPRLHNLALMSPHIFQRFKSVKLYACYQDQTLPQVQFALTSMTNLTKLELGHTIILSLECLWTIVSSFSHLSFLRLYGVAFKLEKDADLSLIEAPPNGPHLETLHILALYPNSQSFLKFILLPQCRGLFLESLRNLYIDLHNPSSEDLSLCCEVVRLAAGTIESLDVRQAFECPLTQWPTIQPLILPPGLRSFSFDLRYRNNEDRTDLSTMRWFIDALSTASHLETLKLIILIPSFEDFAEEDDMWDMFIELSLVLSGYRVFRCLEVTYECDFYVEEEVKAQMLSWTWTGFAFLHERDALKVELSGHKVEYLKV